MAEDCLFCDIASGELESDTVYEDERVLAFRDINPQAPVHLLVIPKEHTASLADTADRELLGHIQAVLRDLAAERDLEDGGYRVMTNVGDHGGQAVYHLHYHLLGGRQLRGFG